MRTVRTKVYKFNELNEDAQHYAIAKLSDINVDCEWWESTYEDAKNIGLKITGFDLNRNRHCKGDFIKGAIFTAYSIKDSHGKDCNTYKNAISFISERDAILNDAENDANENCENYKTPIEYMLDDLADNFLSDLLEDYAMILQKECDCLQSENAITETIEANDYEFTQDGNIF